MQNSQVNKAIGLAWGDPLSWRTYSGLPAAIFSHWKQAGRLERVKSLRPGLIRSIASRRLDWGRIAKFERWAKPGWRYSNRGVEVVDKMLASSASGNQEASVAFQFGMAGSGRLWRSLVSHVELPIENAYQNPVFKSSYGLAGVSGMALAEAVANELEFLRNSALIWTNTPFTASMFPPDLTSKIRVITPGVKSCFPPKDWSTPGDPEVLFVGRDWEGKNGPLVVEAMNVLRDRGVKATLVVVGCSPKIESCNARVVGLLDMGSKADRMRLEACYRSATVFCMPSHWESTGMVFFEAGSVGLPVVMKRIPPTDALFPDELFDKVEGDDPEAVADSLQPYLVCAKAAAQRGRSLREYCNREHGLEAFFSKIDGLLDEAIQLA